MAQAPRHKKMYANSPHLERDGESGKMAIKKNSPTSAEKESSEVNAGTNGIPMTEKTMMDLHDKHAKEWLDLYQKHEREHMETMRKSARSASEEKTGDDIIEKVEKDEKE